MTCIETKTTMPMPVMRCSSHASIGRPPRYERAVGNGTRATLLM